MSNIPIFDAEKEAGLEHLIQSNASIAYHSPILLDGLKKEVEEPNWKSLPIVTKAAKEDKDIHHVYSILVTSSWNKNDDVFSKDEVWAARNTPKYKPTNLEHDEKKIVGGIINSWAVDNDFNVIDENIDHNNLPEHYHILVSSVIYKQWQDPAYQERAKELIEQIEAGDKYVSMECIFNGFDYAVVAPDGNNHIVPRNHETAFLTRHLRAYGGEGSYQEHQIGRLLRNITFSGKGFVNRPANPESVIFDKNKVFEFNNASISSENMFLDENGVIMKIGTSTVLNDQEEKIDMSNELLTEQIKELKNALTSAQAENKELSDRLSVANVEKYEETIEKLTKKLEASEEALAQAKTELEEASGTAETLASDLASKEEELNEVQSHVTAMKEAEKARIRKTSLINAGLSEEEAEAKMETFGNLDDEQFAALAETLADYQTSATQTTECEADIESETDPLEASEIVSEEDEGAEAQADEELLETAQAEEMVSVSVESDESIGEDGTEAVRSSLQDWVNTVILNNSSESGE